MDADIPQHIGLVFETRGELRPGLLDEIKEHGFEVRKTKIKNSCAEVYVVDKQGKRHELFLDPTTGNPAGSDWQTLEKKG
jgi:hypothetical protein